MSTTHFDNPVSTPISAIPAAELTQEGSASCLAALHLKHGDGPVMLRRTDEGRALSRARYRDAASSLITFGLQARTTEGMLYRAGKTGRETCRESVCKNVKNQEGRGA